MKNIYFLLLFGLFFFHSCSQSSEDQLSIDEYKTALAEKAEALDQAHADLENLKSVAPLVHTVYLTLKADITQEETDALIDACKTLDDISTVKNLEVGTFKDLGDERALSIYRMVLQMDFTNEADYQSYQQDPIHLAFKDTAGPYLGAPPATHDFWKQ
jgi:hypothetical protein